jgi:hypothetical protein
MTTATTFSPFFSPISQAAQDALPRVSQPKTLCDHIGSHFFTLNGAWDSARIVEYITNICKYIPMTLGRVEFFDRISSLMNKCGNALSIPRIIVDLHFLKNSARQITQARNLPEDQPERNKIVAHAKKSVVISTMNLVNDASQAALFLNDTSIIKLGGCLPVAEGVYNVSSIVNDTIELIDESFKLHHYNSAPAATDEQRVVLNEKRALSWLKIAKDLPSIVGSVLAIAAIFFAALQAPVFAAISLGLSVAWLTMKLVSTFYEKIIMDRQAHRPALV